MLLDVREHRQKVRPGTLFQNFWFLCVLALLPTLLDVRKHPVIGIQFPANSTFLIDSWLRLVFLISESSTPPVTGRPGTLVCVQCFMNTIEIQEEITWVIMRYVIHYIGLRVLKRSGLKRNIEYCSRTTTRTLIFAKFRHFARYGNIFAAWGSNEEL